jgi:hypothetical protein
MLTLILKVDECKPLLDGLELGRIEKLTASYGFIRKLGKAV